MATQRDLRLDQVSRYITTLEKLDDVIKELLERHREFDGFEMAINLADSDFYETVNGESVPNALGYLNDDITKTGGAQKIKDAITRTKQIVQDYDAAGHGNFFIKLIR